MSSSNERVLLLKAEALVDQGAVYRQSGRPGEARQAFVEGLDIFEELNNFSGQTVALNHLGILEYMGGNLESAFDLTSLGFT